MHIRLPVFVYADDPVSQAGLEHLVRQRPELLVVPTGQIDDARVAVIGTELIDDAAVRTITGVQRDGCPRVVVVACLLDQAAVIAAGDAGTLGMLRRREATPERLAEVVVQAERGHASVPVDLVGQLLVAVRDMRRASSASSLGPTACLTARELDVVRLLAEGQDTAEIASALCYSERTVKGVIHDVTTRLQLRNRSHVVAFALRHEMI